MSPLPAAALFPWASVPARACSCSIIMGGPLTQATGRSLASAGMMTPRLPGSSVGLSSHFLSLSTLHACRPGESPVSASGSSQSPVSLCFPGPVCYSQGLRLAQGASSKSSLIFPFNCDSSCLEVGVGLCPFKNMMIDCYTHTQKMQVNVFNYCLKIMPVQRPRLKHTEPKSRGKCKLHIGKGFFRVKWGCVSGSCNFHS